MGQSSAPTQTSQAPHTPDTFTAGSPATLARPGDPVATPVNIPLQMSTANGALDRLFLPVMTGGRQEHVIIDSGTGRTWFRLPGAKTEWTDDAFVAQIGGQTMSILGRDVPAFSDSVNGRPAIGTVGMDFLSAGPTELDLGRGALIRYPPGFQVPEAATWPTLPIKLAGGLMYANIQVNGRPHQVVLDTGSPTTILVESPLPGDKPRITQDVLGHPFKVWDGSGLLTLGPGDAGRQVAVTRAPSFPHLSDVSQAMGVPVDGLLGLSGLGRGRVIIDTARGVVQIEPSPSGG